MTPTHTQPEDLARFNMIQQQIRPWLVSDPTVLDLLERIPRADFVPASLRSLAYADCELPLDATNTRHGERMLSPKMEARLLQALKLRPHEKVLQIGTGSGYLTALMAHKAETVVTLEHDPAVHQAALAHLSTAGVQNVQALCTDGIAGCPEHAPFDAMVICAAVAVVPPDLMTQLKPGGRLVAIVGTAPTMQVQHITRHADDSVNAVTLFETVVPPLHNAPDISRFSF
jgi:protein-L-isoaspartate(D-aspartate) O-methyltransferase